MLELLVSTLCLLLLFEGQHDEEWLLMVKHRYDLGLASRHDRHPICRCING